MGYLEIGLTFLGIGFSYLLFVLIWWLAELGIMYCTDSNEHNMPKRWKKAAILLYLIDPYWDEDLIFAWIIVSMTSAFFWSLYLVVLAAFIFLWLNRERIRANKEGRDMKIPFRDLEDIFDE